MSYDQTPDSTTKSPRVQARAQNSKACVLVVEDHEDTRYMLRIMLEFRGVSVVEADDGEKAIALAERLRPDLILMDSDLPVLDGYTACRRIRTLASVREIPIIFLSGHAQPAAKVKAFDAGCTAYLVKPLDFDEWDRLLEKHIETNKARMRKAKQLNQC